MLTPIDQKILEWAAARPLTEFRVRELEDYLPEYTSRWINTRLTRLFQAGMLLRHKRSSAAKKKAEMVYRLSEEGRAASGRDL
jgi:DNA-binding HxlR family transcriptional regulator